VVVSQRGVAVPAQSASDAHPDAHVPPRQILPVPQSEFCAHWAHAPPERQWGFVASAARQSASEAHGAATHEPPVQACSGPQSARTRHATQVRSLVRQCGAAAGHWASARQAAQVPSALLQCGFAAGHCASAVQATQRWSLARQCGTLPAQSPSAVQPLTAGTQTLVRHAPPGQSPSARHCTHWWSAARHFGSDEEQSAAATHWFAVPQVLLDRQRAPAPAQSDAARHGTQVRSDRRQRCPAGLVAHCASEPQPVCAAVQVCETTLQVREPSVLQCRLVRHSTHWPLDAWQCASVPEHCASVVQPVVAAWQAWSEPQVWPVPQSVACRQRTQAWDVVSHTI
jgi:hypothetical protein